MHEEIKVKVSKEMKAAIDKAIRMGLFRDQEELLTKATLEKLKKIGIKPKESDALIGGNSC